MKPSFRVVRLASRAISLAVLATLGWGFDASARNLMIGSISESPVQEMREWLPFVRHLASHLSAHGITGGDVAVARDGPRMVELLREGKIDFYVDSPLVVMRVAIEAPLEIIARRWKRGAPEYASVIIVHKDSPIQTLAEIKGHILAFQKPNSTSAYLLPRIEIEARHLELESVANYGLRPAANRIGYVFSEKDENTMLWVARQQVTAGATSTTDLEASPASIREQVRVIHQSPTIPRHVVAVSGRLSPALVAAMQKVLFTMHENEEGKRAIQTFEGTTKFDPVPAASLASLQRYSKQVSQLSLGK
jgi:phosphonate transport system substrate-binding protein